MESTELRLAPGFFYCADGRSIMHLHTVRLCGSVPFQLLASPLLVKCAFERTPSGQGCSKVTLVRERAAGFALFLPNLTLEQPCRRLRSWAWDTILRLECSRRPSGLRFACEARGTTT
jgi:hypothetical protein